MGHMKRKGIILAGGSGTRLHPLTISVSKQLMPIYDKPMIYYPLTTLMLAGIRDILVINTPHEQELFKRLLGTGEQWGLRISYAVQPEPKGLAQAFLIGSAFLDGSPCVMVLGDNIFFGDGFGRQLEEVSEKDNGANVFGYWVKDPSAYGVAEFDANGRVIELEEKPIHPKSNYAVVGLYYYDKDVVKYAEQLKPSKRGELEITDLNRAYLNDGKLNLVKLGRGMAWLDTGSPELLLQAAQFIQTIQSRQGLMVACPEEVAFIKGWIDRVQLKKTGESLSKTAYGQYLLHLEASSA